MSNQRRLICFGFGALVLAFGIGMGPLGGPFGIAAGVLWLVPILDFMSARAIR